MDAERALLLPVEQFSQVVQHTPLVAIDLIVRDSEERVLLGQRRNRPAQGFWFVPGGRIRKTERLDDAFRRLTREELGVAVERGQSRFLGVYEHHYPDNFSGPDFGTHYVVLAHELLLDRDVGQLPVAQHGAYRWWAAEETLASEEVHIHTKWYFQSNG